ncbi:Fc.00g043060.m01.CDS01 [Cosmosporella sp. VM-42]
MSSNSAIDWSPATKQEQDAKDAFGALNTSNDKALIQTGAGKPNRMPKDGIKKLQVINESIYEDDIFRSAEEATQMTFTMLKNEATDKEEELKRILETMVTSMQFKENTMRLLRDADYLRAQYKTGPVRNSSVVKTRYLHYLNRQLRKDTENFQKLLEQSNDRYDEWRPGTGICNAVCGILGWITMSIKTAASTELRRAHGILRSQVDGLWRDRQEETEPIRLVELFAHSDGIDDKMGTTIQAMTELSAFFHEQAICFDKIAGYVCIIGTIADSKSLLNRNAYITDNTRKAVEKLKDVCQSSPL